LSSAGTSSSAYKMALNTSDLEVWFLGGRSSICVLMLSLLVLIFTSCRFYVFPGYFI
jgi:hypothetical protein